MRTLAALAVVAALVVLPQGPVSAACTWNASPLALPAGYVMVKPKAQAGTGLIVGTAYRTNLTDGTNHAYCVVWRNGVPEILPKPPVSGEGSNSPAAVNASGVIAGMWHATGGGLSTPWRYQNGTYQLLPMPVTQVTWYAVNGINAAGDVVGRRTYFYGTRGLLWRADSPSQVTDLGPSGTVGIDAQRRIVLNNGTIINPDGSQITAQGGGVVFVKVFSGGRILGDRSGVRTIIEWNLSGQEVRQLPGGIASAVNTAGTVVGESDVTDPATDTRRPCGSTVFAI